MRAEVSLAVFENADLGEGSIWNPATGELWWVDIERHCFHTFNPENQSRRSLDMGQRIGTVVPSVRGTAIVALQDGVYEFDTVSRTKTMLASPEDPVLGNRFNDGKCDAMGRLWAGTYNLNDMEGRASLYRIEQSGKVTRMLTGVTCSNGICWSRDNRIMYYVDTPTGVVQAFDFDMDSGDISNGRTVIVVPRRMGLPDGMTMDEQGMLWIAMWKGGVVARWNPGNGELLETIALPALNVTSCAFGGKDLDTLFITTASVDMSPEERMYYPLAGCVFAGRPGVRGLPPYIFAEHARQ